MLSYHATLDVPDSTARTISGWLTAHRKTHDIGRLSGLLHPGLRR